MKVKKCSITKVAPGMALAYPVFKENGQFMLAAGTVLTNTMIEQLKFIDVDFLEVFEKTSEKSLVFTTATFNQAYDDTASLIKRYFSTIRYFKEVPLNQMKELVDIAIDPLVNAVGVINHLHSIRRQDDYTFNHSLNVAVISGILGKWLGLQGGELKDVIVAGLLHDIGKIQIPIEILNKPGKLTAEEMEIMKRHSREGYHLLLESEGISEGVLYGVLQHHERNDGSGYPYGILEKDIHSFAKIIALADTYDAMTSQRVYSKKRTPFDVVEVISQDMFDKLDPTVCVIFLNNVTDHFIGSWVRLSDGREAEVIYQGKYYASRPTVCTRGGDFIDLEKHKELAIIELVEN